MNKYNRHIFILFLISFAFAAILYSNSKGIFPHKPHFNEDIKCATCHPKAKTSSKAKDDLLPDTKGCIKECHEEDIFDNIKYARSTPKFRVENNHEIHSEADVKCTFCHRGLGSSKFKPGRAFPKGSACHKCHDNDNAPRTCTLCHIDKVPFSHRVHLDNSIECVGCHKNILTSTETVRGKNMPPEEICAGECHDANDKYAEVTLFDIGQHSPRYEIIFNHEVHIDLDVKCNKCHKGIKAAKYLPGSGKAFPKIGVCFECHDNKTAERTCSLCHPGKVQFPHLIHIKKGMECDECHTKILESKSTEGGKDIPSEDSCSDCHEEKDFYHKITIFPYRQTYVFNHYIHAKEQELECKECHLALYTTDKHAQKDIVPTMNMCFDCHDNSTATQYCTLCHLNPTMPKDHYEDWDKLHKIKARRKLSECNDCHMGGVSDFCFKCHKGAIKPITSHNPNFELTHKYETRARLKNCKTCHSERQCKNCHIAKKVNMRSQAYYNPHPVGFVGDRTSPTFHGRKARLKLSTCTACHTKRDCYCHQGLRSFKKR